LTDEARIVNARIAAAHDGSAELVVTLGYDNGGTADVTLDEAAGAALMEACQASGLQDLTGHSWQSVRQALTTAYNRYQNGGTEHA
jgi:hypothetical protein